MPTLGQPGTQSSGIDPTQGDPTQSQPQDPMRGIDGDGSPFLPMGLPNPPDTSKDTTSESVMDEFGELAQFVNKRFTIFRMGKQREIEPEMRDNARACKGEYTQEQVALMAKNPTGSKVFINITAAEVAKAKTLMLQVLALEQGLPYDIEPSADPDINGLDTEMLKEILNRAKGMIPPEEHDAFMAANDFDGAIKRFKDEAERRCNKMAVVIQDDLEEMHFEESLVRSLDDLAELGTAVFMGPLAKPKKPVKWRKDAAGKWKTALKLASEDTTKGAVRPDVVCLDPFTVYPDPLCTDAKNLTECIVRGVITPYELSTYRKDPSYNADAIDEILHLGKGDWVAEIWEIDVEEGVNALNKPIERYIEKNYWGFLSGAVLKSNGITIPAGTENDFLLVNLIVVAGKTIRATVSNREPSVLPFHFIPYRMVRGRIWGKGVPKQIEDSQAIFNASERAKMDNAGLSVGPMGYFDLSLIGEGCDATKLHPLKMFPITSLEGLTQDPVKFFQPRSNVMEMNAIQDSVKWHMQKCTGIPDSAAGLPGSPAHNRTSEGLSMQQAQALSWIRGVVGNMDLYGFDPIISAIYDWEMQFNPDEDIKGDYNVVVNGVQGAMTREIRSQRINDFLNKFQSPELAYLVDWEKAGYEFEKATGVAGVGLILPYHDAVKRKMDMEQQASNIKTAPDRMSPVIPSQNAALEILQNTDSTSPLYGPAYENALNAFGMINSRFTAALDIANEIAARNAAQLITPQDQTALAADITPPTPPMPPPPGPGGPQGAPGSGAPQGLPIPGSQLSPSGAPIPPPAMPSLPMAGQA